MQSSAPNSKLNTILTENLNKPVIETIRIELPDKDSLKDRVNYWDLVILGQFIFLLLLFFTPVSTWSNSLIKTTINTATTAKDITEDALNLVAPNLTRILKVGDKVGGYTVTDVMGSPREGGKRTHAGTDIGMPEGTQLYIPDSPKQTLDVKFFSYQYNRQTQGKSGGITEYGAEFITSYGIKVRVIHLSKIDGNPSETKRISGLKTFALSGWHHAHIEAYKQDNNGVWVLTGLPFDIAHMMLTGKYIEIREQDKQPNAESNQTHQNTPESQ